MSGRVKYACSKCGFKGRLWRQYNTFACYIELLSWIKHRWPLVEKRMTRTDCLAWMVEHCYQTPPRSSCIGCPFHRDEEWARMKRERPEDFTDAVAFDATIRSVGALKTVAYLHRSRQPLGEVDFVEASRDQLFFEECEGFCHVREPPLALARERVATHRVDRGWPTGIRTADDGDDLGTLCAHRRQSRRCRAGVAMSESRKCSRCGRPGEDCPVDQTPRGRCSRCGRPTGEWRKKPEGRTVPCKLYAVYGVTSKGEVDGIYIDEYGDTRDYQRMEECLREDGLRPHEVEIELQLPWPDCAIPIIQAEVKPS